MADESSSCGGKTPRERFESLEGKDPCQCPDEQSGKGTQGIGLTDRLEKLVRAMESLENKIGSVTAEQAVGSRLTADQVSGASSKAADPNLGMLSINMQSLVRALEENTKAMKTGGSAGGGSGGGSGGGGGRSGGGGPPVGESFLQDFQKRVSQLPGGSNLTYGSAEQGYRMVMQAYKRGLSPAQGVEAVAKAIPSGGSATDEGVDVDKGRNLQDLQRHLTRGLSPQESRELLQDKNVNTTLQSIANKNKDTNNLISSSQYMAPQDKKSLAGKDPLTIEGIMARGRAYSKIGESFGSSGRERIMNTDPNVIYQRSNTQWNFGHAVEKGGMGQQVQGSSELFSEIRSDMGQWSKRQFKKFSEGFKEASEAGEDAAKQLADLADQIDQTTLSMGGLEQAGMSVATMASQLAAQNLNYQTGIINNPLGGMGARFSRESQFYQDVGGTVGGSAAGVAGMVAGGAIGSMFGPAGSYTGMYIGSAIGGTLAGMAGQAAGTYTGAQYALEQKPQRAADILGFQRSQANQKMKMLGANFSNMGDLLHMRTQVERENYQNLVQNIGAGVPLLAHMMGEPNAGPDEVISMMRSSMIPGSKIAGSLKEYVKIASEGGLGFGAEQAMALIQQASQTTYGMGEQNRYSQILGKYVKRGVRNPLKAQNFMQFGTMGFSGKMQTQALAQGLFGRSFQELQDMQGAEKFMADRLDQMGMTPGMLKDMGQGGQMLFQAMRAGRETGKDPFAGLAEQTNKVSEAFNNLLEILQKWGMITVKQAKQARETHRQQKDTTGTSKNTFKTPGDLGHYDERFFGRNQRR